jgi:hypothetical protein
MKKIMITGVSALLFLTTSYLAIPEVSAVPQVTTEPCLSGYILTVRLDVYQVNSPWGLVSSNKLGFNTDAEVNAYTAAYNSTHTATQMYATVICRKAVGPVK